MKLRKDNIDEFLGKIIRYPVEEYGVYYYWLLPNKKPVIESKSVVFDCLTVESRKRGKLFRVAISKISLGIDNKEREIVDRLPFKVARSSIKSIFHDVKWGDEAEDE
jgi:hypothetical protein